MHTAILSSYGREPTNDRRSVRAASHSSNASLSRDGSVRPPEPAQEFDDKVADGDWVDEVLAITPS